MYFLLDSYEAIRDFLELGGVILRLIAVVILIMWVLIMERVLYFRSGYNAQVANAQQVWEGRPERKSWNAHMIREALISRVGMNANEGLAFIKTLVALCPLLGLMGTVTGMIEVFDVMAVSGSGNARSMASGVSKATIPTMAGMVGALSGVFATTWLNRKAGREVELLEDHLTMDH